MIRPAPICFAERTARRPTAPSPTTTAVTPGLTLAASAANQPVPMTSESVSRLGMRSSGGSPGVATSVPSGSGTRSRPACAPPTSSRRTQDVWYPARQIGQVLSDAKNEPMTNWPGLIDSTALPTSSTIPQYSWPNGVGCVTGSDAAVGPEVGPAHARGRHPDDRIRRLRDPRLFALLETHVARCIQNGSSHALSLLERHFTSSMVTLVAPGTSKASTPQLIVPRTTIPGSGIG